MGYFLNVHEGPHSISKNNNIIFKEAWLFLTNLVTTKNKFGIRIENLNLCKENKKKNYFDNLTMAPIDKELIDKNLLNKKRKKWLNDYHQKVFKNILKIS